MAIAPNYSTSNLLLKSSAAADVAMLREKLTPVDLALRQSCERPNKAIDDIYFMETGIASVVSVLPGETHVEIGLVGCEGMTGTAILLGADRSPHSTYMQVAGSGLRMSVKDLRAATDGSASLRKHLLKYAQAFHLQTSHTAVANAQANLSQRLARWLLMAHDRVKGNVLPLTHEFLSTMLAVRRAGVTEAISDLAEQKLIAAARGAITVTNRKGLEKMAGKFYGVPEAQYRRLF